MFVSIPRHPHASSSTVHARSNTSQHLHLIHLHCPPVFLPVPDEQRPPSFVPPRTAPASEHASELVTSHTHSTTTRKRAHQHAPHGSGSRQAHQMGCVRPIWISMSPAGEPSDEPSPRTHALRPLPRPTGGPPFQEIAGLTPLQSTPHAADHAGLSRSASSHAPPTL